MNKSSCRRCIYSSDMVYGVSFDSEGICNYCHQIEELKITFGSGQDSGIGKLKKLIEKIKEEGKGKNYDCVIGVSGGTDSSYLLLKSVEWGLRPLAVHYDNTWNTGLASENIYRITKSLGVPLETFVVDNIEVDEIKRAFLRASIPEFDADTDIAFVQTLRKVAAKYKVKYILEGHSFQTEGVSPIGGNYLDGGYVRDVIRSHSHFQINQFPNLTFFTFLKWIIFYRQKFIRPLWYLGYNKEDARRELQDKLGWVYYGGHHLENRASSFAHTFWLPKKFKTDYRFLSVGASVREGRMDREIGLKILAEPVEASPELVKYVLNRLNLSHDEMEEFLASQNKSWKNYKNYKRRFEILKPFFWLMMKLNLIPKTFYIKYCRKM